MDMQPGNVFIPHDNGAESPNNPPQQPAQPAQTLQSNPTQPAGGAALPPQSTTPYAGYASADAHTPGPALYNQAAVAPEDADWQYNQEPDSGAAAQLHPLPDDVMWSAAEFIEHQKGAGWYGLALLAGLALAGLDFLLFRDIISTVIITLVTILFVVYAGHKPRTQQYRLSPQGLQIGQRLYDFQRFKNFSVAEEGAHISIIFMPLQRFMPLLTVYLTPDIEDRAVDYLSNFLPFEQRRADVIDGLLKRIKF
jgi:hypothetical protein